MDAEDQTQEPQPHQVNISAVVLNGVNLRMQPLPNGQQALVLGPVLLAVPLNDDVRAWLREQLDMPASPQIVIARPNGMPGGKL